MRDSANSGRVLLPLARLAAIYIGANLLAVVIMAAPADASCAALPSLERSLHDADLVFIGTTADVSNGRRSATFSVEDIWKGTSDTDKISVRGGPRDASDGILTDSSVQRTYALETRNLVFASDPAAHGYGHLWGDDGRWEDNACSATQPYRDDLTTFRPASATAVAAPDSNAVAASAGDAQNDNGRLPWLIATASVVAIGGCAAATVLFRRRRRAVV